MKSTPEFKNRYLKEFSYLNLEREFYPLKSNEYKEYIFDNFNKIFMPFEALEQSQVLSLQNIHASMAAIDNVLKPFKDAGIPYSLAATGGAIYDFLTINHMITKDIDLIIHFNIVQSKESQKASDDTFTAVAAHNDFEAKILSKDTIDQKYQQAVHNIITEHAPQLAHADHKYDMKIFSHLVQHMIHKSYYTSQIYTQDNFNEGDYVKMLLHSLIKVSDSKLSKPLDIMLSQHSPQIYCDSFDFNICKNYIIYRNCNYEFISEHGLAIDIEKHGYSPQLVLEHIMCFPTALEDLINKQYTMKLNTLKLSDIEYYMNRHYPRIKEKLPDYDLNFDNAPNEQYIANAYMAAHRYDKLQNKIPHKKDEVAVKNKI